MGTSNIVQQNHNHKIYSNILKNLRIDWARFVILWRTLLPSYLCSTKSAICRRRMCSEAVLKLMFNFSEISATDNSGSFFKSSKISIRLWLAKPLTIRSQTLYFLRPFSLMNLSYHVHIIYSNILKNLRIEYRDLSLT